MLGSSRAIVLQGSGIDTVCYDADFYPYGGEHDYVNTCAQNYKFTGKERDPETNNDDFDARYYASAYGRFLSADWSSTPAPVPYANLTNPQTLNLYAMVSDNPESFADLDGHLNETQSNAQPGACTDSSTTGCSQQTATQNADAQAQTAQNTNQTNEPVLIAQNQTPNPQPGQQDKPQPTIPQEIKDIHSAFDKKVAEMTKNGERVNNGPVNNFLSSLQRIGESLGLTHHHLCSCNEQAEKMSNSLNVSMKDSSYSFGLKQSWTHSWVEGKSSVPGAPVLTIDPWKNKFEVQQ